MGVSDRVRLKDKIIIFTTECRHAIILHMNTVVVLSGKCYNNITPPEIASPARRPLFPPAGRLF